MNYNKIGVSGVQIFPYMQYFIFVQFVKKSTNCIDLTKTRFYI